jgi:hypothetical protein
MFLEDTMDKFSPTNHNGFNVHDVSVFDTALQEIEKNVQRLIHSAKEAGLITIEFARNNYSRAFKQFTPDFLQNAYFLLLDTKIHTCKKRIRDRIAHPKTPDDHFVSEYIFKSYYNKNNSHRLFSSLKTTYNIDKSRLRVINNNGQFEDILEKINQFVDFIYEQTSGDVIDFDRQ